MRDVIADIKQLTEKAEQAEKYRLEVERLSRKLAQISQIIGHVEKVESPNDIKIKIGKGRSDIKYDELKEEWYDKIMAGSQVTMDMIMRTYPEWEEHKARYLWQKLRSCNSVDSAKEEGKRTSFLFRRVP